MRSKVRFYLERPEPGKVALIMLHFRHKTGTFRMSTDEYILTEHWDTKIQRVKEIPGKLEYEEINQVLEDIAHQIMRIYREYKINRKVLQLNNSIFRKRLQAFMLGAPVPEDKVSPIQFIENLIEERTKAKNFTKWATKSYGSTLSHFKKFSKKMKIDFEFEDFDFNFFLMFRDYFWELEPPQSDNNVHKHFKNFKLFLSQAIKRNVTDFDKFNYISIEKDLGVKQEQADAIALFMDELTHLFKFDFSSDKSLEATRDLFIIGCFTGLRYKDWHKVSKDQVRTYEGKEMFEIFTSKTRHTVFIPLHPFVKQIAEKYQWNLPSVPANQVVNRRLKDICELAGLTEMISYTKRIRGKREQFKTKKYKRVSTHTARRSFATNGYLAGIPVEDLMKITAHKTERSFRNYIKSPLELHAHRASQSSFFNVDPVTWKK
jgi:integrase